MVLIYHQIMGALLQDPKFQEWLSSNNADLAAKKARQMEPYPNLTIIWHFPPFQIIPHYGL